MKTKRILIVDDNEESLYLVRTLLKGNDYETFTAANGAEALAVARQTPPDLVISDILMPVMDGFTLCREWKKDERLKLIPFIFYTATYTDERDKNFALSLGAERFIVKPEDPEKLLAEIIDTIRHVRNSSSPKSEPPVEDNAVMKQYNEILIRKLESKMEQLERANRELEHIISSLQAANGALRESVKKYRDLLENISDVIFSLDIKGVFTYVSPAIYPLTGYTPDEMTGRHFRELISPEDQPGLEESFRNMVDKKPEQRGVFCVTKTGGRKQIRISVGHILEGGRITGMRGILSEQCGKEK